LFLTGGYPTANWLDASSIDPLQNIELLIVQDFFRSPLLSTASYALPATSHAEKNGTFVNHAMLAQELHRSIRPPQDARGEGQIYLDLLDRHGLIHMPTIRAEMAMEIPFFAALADAKLPENGVKLGEAVVAASTN